MKLRYRIVLIIFFIIGLIGVIAYARGYRPDFEKKTVQSTGIISISAAPRASKVYINGVLKGATDLNVTLPPGNYKIEVKQAGYTSWTKEVQLKGEVVLTLDVLLLPLNPSLSPLTNLGIKKSIAIPNSEKVILFSETGDSEKDGIYLFEPSNAPIQIFTPLKPIILKKYLLSSLNFEDVSVDVSPDLTQGIFNFKMNKSIPVSYLLGLNENQTELLDITKSRETLLAAWDQQREKDRQKILETFPKEIYKVASDSFHIIGFSPDETKFLYQPVAPSTLPLVPDRPPIGTNQTPEIREVSPEHLYVYDKKEDKNYIVMQDTKWMESDEDNVFRKNTTTLKSTTIPQSFKMLWYSDSKHLVFNEEKKISVIDYDGTNKQTLYSGPFLNSFFTPVADGRIVILLNLNPENNLLPDLYIVGTK